MTVKQSIWRIVKLGWSLPLLVAVAVYYSIVDPDWGSGFLAGIVLCAATQAFWQARELRKARVEVTPLRRKALLRGALDDTIADLIIKHDCDSASVSRWCDNAIDEAVDEKAYAE